MARSDDDCDRNDRQADEEQNPFILFRRYADEQMSSLLQGLIGLPSALTPQSSHERWLRSEEQEIRRQEDEMRHRPSSSSPDDSDQRRTRLDGLGIGAMDIPAKNYTNVDPTSESGQGETLNPAGPSNDRCRHHHDHPSFGPSMFGDDFPLQRGMFPTGLRSGAFPAAWPLGYIIFSPYSPLRLEQQGGFRERSSMWRDAFEDLLAVQAGQGLPQMPRERTGDREQGAGEWVAALLAHGLADGWTRMDDGGRSQPGGDHMAMESDTRHPESDAEDDAATELDLYERYFASPTTPAVRAAATNSSASAQGTSSSNLETPSVSNMEENPSVISALTTTERKVMPDGTVHTKVVLKKKFADGREESSETVHTTQSTSQHTRQAALSPKGTETDPNAAGGNDKGSKGKGWFWSD